MICFQFLTNLDGSLHEIAEDFYGNDYPDEDEGGDWDNEGTYLSCYTRQADAVK